MKKALIIVSVLIAIPSLIFAADRLVIKDDGGTDVFAVEDTRRCHAPQERPTTAFADL